MISFFLYTLISKHVLLSLLLTVHFVSRELHSQMIDTTSNTYKCNYINCMITFALDPQYHHLDK